jgi:ADP-dependent NAD(P)H-hydrate dehydratase / NAD(P)H-hydrate epimerase
VIPVLTPEEMAAVDAAAPEPVEVLIERAGAAVAREAMDLLEGAYGRRVVVVAGKGNNGNDGRAAAVRLRRRGVRVAVVDAAGAPRRLPPCDLVIDAAYGTGFRGTWEPPDPGGAPVLAVDIPSGVDGRTSAAEGEVLSAERTVTFAALKPGLLFGRGPELAGDVRVADIGLDTRGATTAVVEDGDVAGWLPRRPRETHKWQAAVWVVAGSPGMAGAAALAARGAQRVGAGYVRLSTPGGDVGEGAPLEAVGTPLPAAGWAAEVLEGVERFAAVVVGPGLGREQGTATEVRRLVAECPVPILVDGDGLSALGGRVADVVDRTTVLTPHDGEFARLSGVPPGSDRIAAATGLAQGAGCFVLLKGSTTTVAAPDAGVLLATAGDPRLATAGTGDVLSGAIGGLLAQGLDPGRAAAAGAHLHGRAARLGPPRGLVAGDLPDLLPAALAALAARG